MLCVTRLLLFPVGYFCCQWFQAVRICEHCNTRLYGVSFWPKLQVEASGSEHFSLREVWPLPRWKGLTFLRVPSR